MLDGRSSLVLRCFGAPPPGLDNGRPDLLPASSHTITLSTDPPTSPRPRPRRLPVSLMPKDNVRRIVHLFGRGRHHDREGSHSDDGGASSSRSPSNYSNQRSVSRRSDPDPGPTVAGTDMELVERRSESATRHRTGEGSRVAVGRGHPVGWSRGRHSKRTAAQDGTSSGHNNAGASQEATAGRMSDVSASRIAPIPTDNQGSPNINTTSATPLGEDDERDAIVIDSPVVMNTP